MSASREKKERRSAGDASLSPRAQEELKKAAQRKRNTIVYSIIAIVVVILVAALLIWNSGIIQRSRTVAVVDGQKVTAPQVLYYYQNNTIIYNTRVYSQLGYSSPYYSLSDSPREQTITADAAEYYGIGEEYVDKSYHEYFLDSALNSLHREFVLREAAKEAGYTLSDAGKQSVKDEMADLDDGRESLMAYGYNLSRTGYLKMTYGELMNESAYRKCVENNLLANEYYSLALESLTDYSDEELRAYYEEHKEDYDTISFYQQYFPAADYKEELDEDATEEETAAADEAAMAAAEQAANDALAAVEADPDSLKDNEDFTYSNDLLYQFASSVYYDFLTDESRQSGDTAVVEASSGLGYYLVVFEERKLDETPTRDVRHILIAAETAEEDDPATEDVDESKTPSDEAFAAAEAKAQELLDQWKAGEATEDSFAALAEEYSADTTAANGGLITDIDQNLSSLIAGFSDWTFDSARQPGDTGLVQNTSSEIQGWHIIYYVGEDTPTWMTSVRRSMWTEDVLASADIERTDLLDSVVD